VGAPLDKRPSPVLEFHPVMLVRPCLPNDAEAVAALAGELGYPSTAEQIRSRLEWLLGRDGHAVFAAEVDGRVVGWSHVHETRPLESEPFAELAGLVVAAGHRGTGIGKALVEAAVRWAAARRLATLRVRSNVIRTDAHRFYAARGFERLKTQAVFARTSVIT
jgi:GNAT superfamily N-acetyltransferase